MELKRVIRLDSMPLDGAYFTEEGYLIDNPICTSTGIFEYANPDGSIRRELRLPEEVFDEQSLASYEGKPVILTHAAGLVTAENESDAGIGTILSKGYRDGEFVRARVVIHDTNAMKQAGLRELSLGYDLRLDETPGVWRGQHYDAVQRDIRINHLALVQTARAGESARLNIDSRDGKTLIGGKAKMRMKLKKGRLDAAELTPEEIAAALAQAIAKKAGTPESPENEDEDDTEAMTETPETEEHENMDGEETLDAIMKRHEKSTLPKDQRDEDIDALIKLLNEKQAQEDFHAAADEDEPEGSNADEEEAEETNEDEDEEDSEEGCAKGGKKPAAVNMDALDALIVDRLDLARIAERLHMDELSSMPMKAAKRAVIAAVRPNIRLDGKDDSYVEAMFDAAKDEILNRKDVAFQRRQMRGTRQDSAEKGTENTAKAVSSREKMINKMKGETK